MHEKKIQEALQGVKILEESKLTQIIYESLFKIQTDMGLKLGDQELTPLVNTFTIDIGKDFKFLTVQEVQLALYLGARGELGKSYGLSATTCYKWVKDYTTIRKEYRTAPVRRQLGERRIDLENHETQKEFYDFLIDTVKKFNEIPYWNYTPVFAYMVREGILVLSEEQEKEINKCVRLAKVSQSGILDDPEQMDVLFTAEAVRQYLEKTYGVKRFELRLTKVEKNMIRL